MSDMTTEERKSLIRRSFEALSERNRDAFRACFADDFVVQPFGLELDEFVDDEFAYFDAFPDLTYTLDEQIVEGNRLAFRWSMSGTHAGDGGPGPFQNIDPTHEAIDVSGMNFATIEDGKIAAWRAEWGVFDMLHQLGVVSIPG